MRMTLLELLLVVCGLALLTGTLAISFTLPWYLYSLSALGAGLIVAGCAPGLWRRWRT
jgi:hypothetical protein